jgi:hypothetical protein
MAKSVKKKGLPRKKAVKLHKYRYFVVNIKIRTVNSTEDLPRAEYARIFREFYQSFIVARSARQKDCLLTSQVSQTINEEPVFWGQIFQVTNINNKKWFNKKDKVIDTNFKIPPEYAANAVSTEYLFVPSIHRFAYLSRSTNYIDPYAVKKYFTTALNRHLSTGYVVDVDVEADPATIQKIFDAPKLKRLFVKINYSNNDFSKEMQEFIEEDMKASNVGHLEITAVQKTGNSIDVNSSQILAGALESSASNGLAEATILDYLGKPHKIKTQDAARKVEIVSTKEEKVKTLFNKIKDEFPAN